MNSAGTKPVEFRRDIRLGLVLYGGVSLAIYMNGTTNELFRAVRGRGVFFLLKHLLDADITVDVVSGASAGGINGIFLAFALANDREFGTCADLWRRDGDLNTLLNQLDHGIVPSVLDSDHYRDLLENGFRHMWGTPLTNEAEAPSETRELDLFVAGTDFYGRITNEVDATGRVIETKQHRSVFLLKHRQRNVSKCQLDPRREASGRWPNAKPQDPSQQAKTGAASHPETSASPDVGLAALAKLAQITSCFPGAFAPVHFQGEVEPDGSLARQVDFRLQYWGKLGVGERYFVDGGVLDNKPFTTTLDTIFHRPAHRRVCRHLLYLEPDPERFSDQAREKKQALVAPSFLSTVLDAVTRLPAYESIADDLARVTEHNASIQRFAELVDALTRNGVSIVPGQQAPSPEQNPSEHPLHKPATPKLTSREQSYRTARLLGIARRVTEKIAEALDSKFKPEVSTELLEGLRKSILPEHIDAKAAQQFDELLRRVDVDYYIRRAIALTYYLEPRSDEPRFRDLWTNINNELEHLEIISSALENVVIPKSITLVQTDAELRALDPLQLWNEILARSLALLEYTGLEKWMREEPSYATLAGRQNETLQTKDYRREEFRQALQARLKSITEDESTFSTSAKRPRVTLLEASDKRLSSLVAKSGCDLSAFFRDFEHEDRLRFPLELAGGVRQRDKISVVRLSPVDAKAGLSDRTLEEKICGETFGHFGAFLKKSWRSNDILWGRLDGIARLVETLLDHTQFSSADGKTRQLPKLDTKALLSALGQNKQEYRTKLGELFPHLHQRVAKSNQANDPLNELLEVLESLDGQSPEARTALRDRLIHVAQLDALCEDLPKVVADAAQEQLEWGQVKVEGTTSVASASAKEAFFRRTVNHVVDSARSVTERFGTASTPKQLKNAAEQAQRAAKDARVQALQAEKEACKAEKKARRARERAEYAAAKAEKRDPKDLAFSAVNWQFKANVGALDASLINLATQVFAQNALSAMSTSELQEYFQKRYAVGNESATGAMPATVLIDLGARAAVLTESALVASGKLGLTLRDNKLYKNIVRHPLRVIAGLAAFVRRAPTARIAIIVGSLLYALLALITNLTFTGSLYADGTAKRTIAIWMFGIIPMSLLLFSWAVWRSVTWKRVVVILVWLGAIVYCLLNRADMSNWIDTKGKTLFCKECVKGRDAPPVF